MLFKQFLSQIDAECNRLCQGQPNATAFRKIPQSSLTDSIGMLLYKIYTNTPLILSTIACHGDHRNKIKVGNVHNPGICMAAAVILKEQNCEMNGVQSLVSLLLFTSHINKQVYVL